MWCESKEHHHFEVLRLPSQSLLRPPPPPRTNPLRLCFSFLPSVALWICRSWHRESTGPAQTVLPPHWVPETKPTGPIHRWNCPRYTITTVSFLVFFLKIMNLAERERESYHDEGVKTDKTVSSPSNTVGKGSEGQEKGHKLHALCGNHNFLRHQKGKRKP